MRNRTCNNPQPSRGGVDCSKFGNDTEYRSCSMKPCPLHDIVTSGMCTSVTEDYCKQLMSGNLRVTKDRGPIGCFNYAPNNWIYFNTNATSLAPCTTTRQCVCIPIGAWYYTCRLLNLFWMIENEAKPSSRSSKKGLITRLQNL